MGEGRGEEGQRFRERGAAGRGTVVKGDRYGKGSPSVRSHTHMGGGWLV